MSRITINLNEKEVQLKEKIKDLQKIHVDGNPYINRSESEIAKMILEPALMKEHRKFVDKGK